MVKILTLKDKRLLDFLANPVGTRCCCNVAIRLQSDRDVAQHKSNVVATSSLQRYLYVVSATL